MKNPLEVINNDKPIDESREKMQEELDLLIQESTCTYNDERKMHFIYGDIDGVNAIHYWIKEYPGSQLDALRIKKLINKLGGNVKVASKNKFKKIVNALSQDYKRNEN